MGQIVFNGQKPKYANLVSIKTGSQKDYPIPANEIWLIDSTNATKNNGKGKYDKYVIGDGHTAAKNLPLLNVDPEVPTHLSQLISDTDHKTVSDEQISNWNNAAAGEGGTLIESSEDISVINDAQQNINRLELADKQYNALNHSGLGKVYLKKNVQTVHTFNTEVIFDSITADYARRDAYDDVWQKTHDATYKSLAEATDNTDAKAAANTAYNTAYNNAINGGKTVEEATALGNAAYVTAYKNAVSSIEGKDTAIEDAAKTTANNAFETASAEAIAEIYPQVHQIKKHYIDGIIQGTGDNRYINITPVSRFSTSYFRIDAEAGSKYKIFATKSDTLNGAPNLSSRFWIVTETPQQGAATTKFIKGYKEDGTNIDSSIVQEAAIIEVDQDCTIWVNYIFYSEHMEPCKIERIYETQNTTEVNIPPVLTEPNTEYIVRYDYDLAGGMLEVPENSVLKFDGGSITNGYIKGNNSSISAFPSDTILPSVTLTGNWKNTDYYAKWFGAAGDGVTDDTDVLQRMLDISEGINKKVNLIWEGYTFKTTHGLFIKSNTAVKGGHIVATFDNPLDWILQTRSFYSSGAIETTLPPNYAYIASWQEFDGRGGDLLNHITNSSISYLTLSGTLNKHMVIPEGGDETSEKVWDNTYCPIYGGLKINGGSIPTQNVTIRNTGIGIARGACLHSYDNHLDVGALFVAYAGRAINTTVVTNSYLNAHANTTTSGKSNYTPYYLEYQGFNAMDRSWYMGTYIEGNGGIDDSDETLLRPKFCSVKLCYGGILFNNTVTDSGAEVAFAGFQSSIIVNYPYLEGVDKCFLYGKQTRFFVNNPEVTSDPPEYDLIGTEASFTLVNCGNRIECRGGVDGENHKYALDSGSVNIVAKKETYHPDDNRFYFLAGDDSGLPITSVAGNTLEAAVGKYYKFDTPVETLAVTLPAMGTTNTVKSITIDVTNKNTANFISFTSADAKPIAQYSNNDYSSLNTEYEISCMYNGTKWIIAAALIG